jgi:hypothetical protein
MALTSAVGFHSLAHSNPPKNSHPTGRFLHLNQKQSAEGTMSQGLYLFGFVIVIAGVAYMAHLMHLPSAWIGAIVLVLLGIGVVTMVQNTRHKDPS